MGSEAWSCRSDYVSRKGSKWLLILRMNSQQYSQTGECTHARTVIHEQQQHQADRQSSSHGDPSDRSLDRKLFHNNT